MQENCVSDSKPEETVQITDVLHVPALQAAPPKKKQYCSSTTSSFHYQEEMKAKQIAKEAALRKKEKNKAKRERSVSVERAEEFEDSVVSQTSSEEGNGAFSDELFEFQRRKKVKSIKKKTSSKKNIFQRNATDSSSEINDLVKKNTDIKRNKFVIYTSDDE